MLSPAKAHRSRTQAIFELSLLAILWGFGFVATRWALVELDTLWVIALRFFLVIALLGPFFFFYAPLRNHLNKAQFFLALPPGLFLGLALVLQTHGLLYTSLAKNGFITVLYVLFVPLLERYLGKAKVSSTHMLLVFVALVGAALMCQMEMGSWNYGDFLTLLCAIALALQTYQIGVISHRIRSSFVFNLYQIFWAGLLPLVIAICFHGVPKTNLSPLVLESIAFLAFGATLFGFFLQVKSQRVLPASLASLFFLLEAPAAAIFGYLCFGEALTTTQSVGAFLILLAAAGAVRLSPAPIVEAEIKVSSLR